MNKPKTTSQQLTRLFLKLFIVILLLVNLAFVLISTTFIYQEAKHQSEQVIENISYNLTDKYHLKKKRWVPVLNAYVSKQEDNAIELTTRKNEKIFSAKGEKIFNRINNKNKYQNLVFSENNVYYFSQVTINRYKLKVAINVDDLFELVLKLTGAMLVLNILAIIFSIPLIHRLAKKWSYPVEKMDQQIKNIENTQPKDPQISVPTHPKEIKNLAQSFNELLKVQTHALEREKQFVTDASHELKTPIAALRGHINLIKRRGKSNPEIFEKSLPFLESESKRMQELVNELLELGRVHKAPQNLSSNDLIPVIHEEVNRIEKESKRKIQLEISNTVNFPITINDFKHLLDNLLSNAVKYSSENSAVFLKVISQNNELLIEVKDKGQGVKKENHEKIFERFFREDEAHSSHIKGTGLGLAIVKAIVDKYQGKIKVEDNHPQGAIFIIKFKK